MVRRGRDKGRDNPALAVLGLDVGGVLIERTYETADSFFSGRRPMEVGAIPGAPEAVRVLSAAFGHRVYVVSRAGPRVSGLTRQWLGEHGFLGDDKIPAGHIHFVRRREDKHLVCEQLGVTHFVDDRADVLGSLLSVTCRYLFTRGLDAAPAPARVDGGIVVVDAWPTLVQLILASDH